MKKILFLLIFFTFIIVYRFWDAYNINLQKSANEKEVSSKKIIEVKSVNSSNKSFYESRKTYIGIAQYENTLTITSKAQGQITFLGVKTGDTALTKSHIATIDDFGSDIKVGKNGMYSFSVKKLEISLDIAKKAYKIASATYKENKTDSNKKLKDIAKLNVDSAESDLQEALNAHIITSPKTGIITDIFVDKGDSISVGSPLFSLSESNMISFQFFVNSEDVLKMRKDFPISVKSNERHFDAKIRTVVPKADDATGLFLVETYAQKLDGIPSGSPVQIEYIYTDNPVNNEYLFLPISALSVNQDGNSIFVEEYGIAREIPVEVFTIIGGIAQIKNSLDPNSNIIIEGNKLIENGSSVKVVE